MRPARAASALPLALACLCAGATHAAAAPRVALSMRFAPNRPGQSTTIHWGFRISEPTALRTLQLTLPAGLGFAASSLGLESCDPARLLQAGPSGCPADSRLGFGTALAEVQAERTVQETAHVTALLGPETEGEAAGANPGAGQGTGAPSVGAGQSMTVLFFVDGRAPVNREIVLTSHLTDLAGPHGASLLTEVPPLPVWPAGPNIGLIRFNSTIGPAGLTYYRRLHGHTVPFTPRGLTVPQHCPRGGFPVSATFSWWTPDAPATARTRVPCGRGARERYAGARRR